MARKIKKTNKNIDFLCGLAVWFFRFIRLTYRCKPINFPKEQCIFALLHAHQCGVFTCNQMKKTAIMVSNSADGEIISRAANGVGVTTVRGSQNKGGAKASMELITKINEGYNGALTIDGPRGPKEVVKKGIVEIARMTQKPIVPAIWWSPDKTFLKFKSWDEFRFPLPSTRLVMLFGDLIYVPKDADDAEIERIRKEVEDKLAFLKEDVQVNFKKYWKEGKVHPIF